MKAFIINISSLNGPREATLARLVYGATKVVLDGLTRGLARELGSRGIRVNLLHLDFRK